MYNKKTYSTDCTNFDVLGVAVDKKPVIQPGKVEEEERCCVPIQIKWSLPKFNQVIFTTRNVPTYACTNIITRVVPDIRKPDNIRPDNA